MRRTRLLAALAATTAVLPFLPQASASYATPTVEVLSGRADLVSGGDALVQVSGLGVKGVRV